MEYISRQFARLMRESDRFILTGAVTGSGATSDNMILGTRDLRQNREFNQRTIAPTNELLAPKYSLMGKVVKDEKYIGRHKRVDYNFLFVLTRIQDGIVVWDYDKTISKVIELEIVNEYSRASESVSEYEDEDESEGKSFWEFLGLEDFSFENFGFIASAEFGFGAGKADLKPVPYVTADNKDTYTGHITLKQDDLSSPDYTPFYLKGELYYRQVGGYYLSAVLTYTSFSANFDSEYDFNCSSNTYGYCSWHNVGVKGYNVQMKLLGLGFRFSPSYGDFMVFGGGGIFKDVGSSASLSGFPYTEKISSTYPYWEIGLLGITNTQARFPVVLELNYRYMIDGKAGSSWASIASLTFGVGFMF